MANSKRVRIQITNSPEGGREHTSLARARRFVTRGTAIWVGKSIEFITPASRGAHSPNLPAVIALNDRIIRDSGFSTARYPLPMGGGIGAGRPKWPALSRPGAGIAT